MEEMSFDEILNTLKRWFQGSTSRKSKRDGRNITMPFKGFQAPLRGALHNSGGFDPSGKGSVGRVHQGLDLRNPIGSSIYPIAAGIVKYVRPDPKGGNTVVIDHQNEYSSYYAHCAVINVIPGERVNNNTIIAKVGASGNAKGFGHLHIQIWHNGALIDPAAVIPGIPPPTPFNAKTERLALPGAKEEAAAWNIQDHLATKRNKAIT